MAILCASFGLLSFYMCLCGGCCGAQKKTEAAEYHKLLVQRLKEQRERRSESLAKKARDAAGVAGIRRGVGCSAVCSAVGLL